jgi:hypothetical protein
MDRQGGSMALVSDDDGSESRSHGRPEPSPPVQDRFGGLSAGEAEIGTTAGDPGHDAEVRHPCRQLVTGERTANGGGFPNLFRPGHPSRRSIRAPRARRRWSMCA